MSVKNVFLQGQSFKSQISQGRVNISKLIEYSKKCDKVLFGCDEIKAISQGDGLKNAPCFQVSNDSNSKEKVIPGEYFSCGCFASVSVIYNSCTSYDLYSVVGVYEGMPLNLMDFKFYSNNSRQVNVNGYISDITIHGKAFRLFSIEGTNFQLRDFLYELVAFEVKDKEGIRTRMYSKYLEEYYITRYDYRFDFFCKYDLEALKFRDVFKGNSNMKHEDLVKDRFSKKIYTGWSAGNRKNHYVYTRYYQKQVEVLDHGLEDLYYDYLNYDGKVWRLEFEFGSDFTVKARLKDVGKHYLMSELTFISDNALNDIKQVIGLPENSLEAMVFEYIGLKFKNGAFSCPKSEKPSFKDRSIVSRTRALHMFWSIGKSILDSGDNPYHYLDLGLSKSGITIKSLDKLKKQAISKDNELEMLNFKFENYKKEKQERYKTIYKNQLGIEL